MAGQMPWEMNWGGKPAGEAAGKSASTPGGRMPWEMDWSKPQAPPERAAPTETPDALTTGGTGYGNRQPGATMASPRAAALRETITGPAEGGDERQWLERQGAIETRLRGEGMSDAQIQENPEWQQTSRNLSRAVSASNTGMAVGNVGGDLAAPLIARAAAPVVRGVQNLYARATGRGATQGAEALRATTLKDVSETVSRQQGSAAAQVAEAEAARGVGDQAAATRQQVIGGAEVAAQRAEARSVVPMEQERERVLASLRQRTHAMDQEYRRAGFGVEESKRMVAQAERQFQEAETAAQSLDQQLLQRPGMTPDQFGQELRSATRALADKHEGIRSTQAGFGKAIEEAGDKLRVNTSGLQSRIDGFRKDIRNPQLARVLDGVSELIKTDGNNALSVRSADSLRKYLDSVVKSRQFGETALDAETSYAVGQLKKQLVETSTAAWTPYRDALAKWRVLSRPLDIVERKGALAKTLSTDPVSADYALTQAQVVGNIVRGGKAGSQALGRLVEGSPEIRDAGRLYFTQDLFGKEVAPTAASMRTWLKTNEGPLRQLGIFEDFRDMKVARETAQRAVREAKGVQASSLQQVRQAEAAERAAAGRLKETESLRDAAKSRMAGAEKEAGTAETQRATSIEARRAEAAKRLTEREKAAGKTAAEATRGAEAARKAADTYRQLQTDLRVATAKDMPATARGAVSKMRSDGHISDRQYEEALRQIQAVEQAGADGASTRKRLAKIAGTLAAGAVGAETVRRFGH